ncbi:MAG: hypothetical protein CM1200mP26_01820 [Acidimicrobiales bacterium]|nr:MAG: hypothetical protein CM1200mP26_01820 [Acidimicrobiales bacterium]
MDHTTHPDNGDRLYFRQLLAGRDFATEDQMARQMVNFVYLIGDRETGDAVVVDPAYDVDGILDVLADDDMRCTGALATHYHPDHVGGSMMGFDIVGAAELLERTSVPIHAQHDEVGFIAEVTGLGDGDIVGHESGDVVTVGAIDIELIHTPGHTPGSQCFLVDGRLVAGDTLFLEGCGRTTSPVATPLRCTTVSTTAWPRCPTRQCSTQATSTRRSHQLPWGTPDATTSCSCPAPRSSG